MFDLLAFIQNIMVTLAVGVGFAALWQYRSQVLLLLTGDDRIHGSPLDFVWWSCFRCCGTCSGEWTRYLTNCPCIPKRWQRSNVVRMAGQVLGFATYTMELKNIVIGDLPCTQTGDYFLQVDASSNPPLKTALQEDKDPKVIHFPEVLTLRIKKSMFEEQVVIRVLQLKLLGSTELCELRLNAQSILDWASEPGMQTKRFAMKVVNNVIEVESPPWILLQFDQPTEARELETLHDPNIVRTIDTETNTLRDANIDEFKADYQLVDTSGQVVTEPLEGDLLSIAMFRSRLMTAVGLFSCMTFLVVPAYLFFRFYIWSCYRHFQWITIAKLNNMTFPISTHRLAEEVHRCDDEYGGTGLTGIPCSPNQEQILSVCEKLPAGQPPPTAFTVNIHENFGLDVGGVGCFDGICSFRNKLTEWDRTLFLSCLLLVSSVYACRHMASYSLRQRKIKINQKRAQEMRQAQGMASRGGTP